MGAFLVVVPTI